MSVILAGKILPNTINFFNAMKTKLLFMLLFGAVALINAQDNSISWTTTTPAEQFSITIEAGESVTWVCTDFFPHSVVSTGGTDTFNSGTLYMNNFTHQFDTVGTTTYHDGIFGAQMQGTITVTEVAGVKEIKSTTFNAYPNPTNNIVTLKSNNIIDAVTIYDMTGRQLLTAKANATVVNISMANYPAGTYMVKANAGTTFKTTAVVKQ